MLKFIVPNDSLQLTKEGISKVIPQTLHDEMCEGLGYFLSITYE